MKRTLTTTRLFSLGDFKNISFSDTIEDIPEELAFNEYAMNLLRSLQLFQLERAYLKYLKLRDTRNRVGFEEAIELMNELDVKTSKKFIELFQDVPLEEELQVVDKGEN